LVEARYAHDKLAIPRRINLQLEKLRVLCEPAVRAGGFGAGHRRPAPGRVCSRWPSMTGLPILAPDPETLHGSPCA
jgi:hypothetical protein